MKIVNFRDLDIWKLGKEIVVDVYKTTETFPKEEMFGIISQMRRASVSIPSNIAEGFGRFQNREYRRYLYISMGSCSELETQVEISSDLGFINQEKKMYLIEKINHQSRMVQSLINKLN